MSTSLVTANHVPEVIVQRLKAVMPTLGPLLPPDVSYEQFRAGAWLELTTRQGLVDCTPDSIRQCVIESATYGLMPGRDCVWVPFREKKGNVRKATRITTYPGVIRSLERTGKIRKAFAHPVYVGERFEVDYLGDVFSHVPNWEEQKHLRCFYGCIITRDGTRHLEVMTLEQIDAIKRRAPAHQEGPWVSDFIEMARKTALKRAAKYVALTPAASAVLDEPEGTDEVSDQHKARLDAELFGSRDPEPALQPEEPGETFNPTTGEVLEPDEAPDAERHAPLL
jgi:recombination protein RecT